MSGLEQRKNPVVLYCYMIGRSVGCNKLDFVIINVLMSVEH